MIYAIIIDNINSIMQLAIQNDVESLKVWLEPIFEKDLESQNDADIKSLYNATLGEA